jgi:hypothetical protein
MWIAPQLMERDDVGVAIAEPHKESARGAAV